MIRRLTSRSRLVATVTAIALSACGARLSTVGGEALDSEGCPVILLVRQGALGREAHGGVIAAVWASGRILRAESPKRPSGPHVLGQLGPADFAALEQLAGSETVWAQASGEVALDMPADVLTLRRADKQREWVETPGVTTSSVVVEFRRKLLEIDIDDPRRTNAVKLGAKCGND